MRSDPGHARLPAPLARAEHGCDGHDVAPLQVLLAGKLTALAAPGGGEVQMQATAEALRELGIAARMWRPWEDDLADCDLLHLFGSVPDHLSVIEAAQQRGVPVVLSTIAWYDLRSLWREPRGLARRLAGCGRFLLRAAVPRVPSWRRQLYHSVDLLLPNSQAEARQLQAYFGVPCERIHVVPNGADLRFVAAMPDAFVEKFGVRDFVLYAGRIEPRKNQLNFLRAMEGTNVPVVILGDVVPGHERYAERCRQVAGPRVRFLDRFEHHDPLLASAYAACRCLVLASWFETPGLVALEAGLLGTPLVLTRRGCTPEYFGSHAQYVRPDDLRGIRATVMRATWGQRNAALAEHVRRNFSWAAAAQATAAAYEKLLAHPEAGDDYEATVHAPHTSNGSRYSEILEDR
jgi:glycosyltransferase involved in cell wall biosynthesis